MTVTEHIDELEELLLGLRQVLDGLHYDFKNLSKHVVGVSGGQFLNSMADSFDSIYGTLDDADFETKMIKGFMKEAVVERQIIITFSDGQRYSIPASVVANSRATYYAELDAEKSSEEYDMIYKTEYDYTISDDYELLDWLHNNMVWVDVISFATKLASPQHKADYAKEFTNAEVEVL